MSASIYTETYVKGIEAQLAEARAQLVNRGLALEAAEEECVELRVQIAANGITLASMAEMLRDADAQIANKDEVLRKIRMRSCPHPDDTLEDCKYQLRHIAGLTKE